MSTRKFKWLAVGAEDSVVEEDKHDDVAKGVEHDVVDAAHEIVDAMGAVDIIGVPASKDL